MQRRVEAALVQSGAENRVVTAEVREVQPDVTRSELAERYGTVLAVDRGNFRIRLYNDLKLSKTYPIALGEAGQ